jgi:hypothetical protein
MASVKRVVLDVLKPHRPNALEFARAVADQHQGHSVTIKVTEMDEKTETTVFVIEGDDLDYDGIVETIQDLGGSVHSIDEVKVTGDAETES